MVNTIGTPGSYVGPNSANSATPSNAAEAARSQNPDQQGRTRSTPDDSVNLSAAARAVLNGASARVDSLLEDFGESIFRNGLEGGRAHRENLALTLENPNTDNDARREARIKLLERERDAFTAPEHTGDLLTRARAYIEFYDSLSPEEQASERYAGTRETMAAIVASESAEQGRTAPDMTAAQTPFDILLKALDEADYETPRAGEEDGLLERFRTESESLVGSAASRQEQKALETRYRSLQDLIERSRKGDEEAFRRLEELADKPVAQTDPG